MNRNIIGAVLILAGIAAAVFNWAYKPATDMTSSPASGTAAQQTPPPSTTPPAGGLKPSPTPTPVAKPVVPTFTSNILVSIKGFEFVSETVRVKAGTKITWTNFDTAGHTVTSDTGLFGSNILSKEKSFEYIFNTPGTYTYHCTPHPDMKGEIIVE